MESMCVGSSPFVQLMDLLTNFSNIFSYNTLLISVVRCSFGEIIKVDPNFNFVNHILLNKRNDKFCI